MAREKKSTKSGTKNASASVTREASVSKEKTRREKIRGDVTGFVLMVLGLFLFFSLITSFTGLFGKTMADLLFGISGILAYVLCLLICAVGWMVMVESTKNSFVKHYIALCFFTLFLFMLVHYISHAAIAARMRSDAPTGAYLEYIVQSYLYGKAEHLSAGAIGGALTYPVEKLLGSIGTILFSVAGMIVCFTILFSLSLRTIGQKVQKGMGNAARQVSTNVQKYREERSASREEQRKEREFFQEGKTETAKPADNQEGELIGFPVRDSLARQKKPVLQNGQSGTPFGVNGRTNAERKTENSGFGLPAEKAKTAMGETADPEKKKGSRFPITVGESKHMNGTIGGKDSAQTVTSSAAGRTEPASKSGNKPAKQEDKMTYPPLSAQADASVLKEDSEEEGMTFEELLQQSKDQGGVVAGDGIEYAPEKPINWEAALHGESKPITADDVAQEVAPVPPKEEYHFPPLELLSVPNPMSPQELIKAQQEQDRRVQLLEETLGAFGIDARVIGVQRGPAITCFELQPARGVKVSRITGLSDDIALNLAAAGVRIEAPIPGKAAIGIEVPNQEIQTVPLREVLESEEFIRHPSKLAVGLGKDINGHPIVADLAKMPHLLVAGQTGSGKSVCINSLITSILYKSSPDEVRLILIDPKVVELKVYNDVPHLLIPVVTDPKKAAGALAWAVQEMTDRYNRFAETGRRDISGYNEIAERNGWQKMPQIVVIIDELADLMMVAPGEVEDRICRLAQLARAAGIHLVIATQRPSVNVITGVIKANIPSRIAFAVASQVDSRTILDIAGAEKLLGKGDMLFDPSGASKPTRVQGAFVSDQEVEDIVAYVKMKESYYDQSFVNSMEREQEEVAEEEDEDYDPLLPQAVELAIDAGQVSTSMLQRRFRIGHARAGRIVDQMELRGLVSPFEGSKPRQILIGREEFQRMFGDSDEDFYD